MITAKINIFYCVTRILKISTKNETQKLMQLQLDGYHGLTQLHEFIRNI